MGFFDKLLGGGAKTPAVSNPQDVANQQQLSSRYNIMSPEGGRTFTTDASGRTVLNITETPFQQQQRAERQALATDFLKSLEGGDARFGAESKRIGDLIFERGMSRLKPLLDERRRSQVIALANQGLPVGSEAQSAAEAQLGRNENDLLTQLAGQSELAASQEQDRLRRLAGNEAQSFFGGEIGGINVGNFSNVTDPNIAGIIQQGDINNLARAKQEQARQGTMFNNALSLGTGLATGGMSFFMPKPSTGGDWLNPDLMVR